MAETVEELASEHWGYVKSLLEAHLEDSDKIDIIEFHYKSAFIHGYKHCEEQVALDLM